MRGERNREDKEERRGPLLRVPDWLNEEPTPGPITQPLTHRFLFPLGRNRSTLVAAISAFLAIAVALALIHLHQPLRDATEDIVASSEHSAHSHPDEADGYAARASAVNPPAAKTRSELVSEAVWNAGSADQAMPSKEEMRKWLLDPANSSNIREAIRQDRVLALVIAPSNSLSPYEKPTAGEPPCCGVGQAFARFSQEELEGFVNEGYLTTGDLEILSTLREAVR